MPTSESNSDGQPSAVGGIGKYIRRAAGWSVLTSILVVPLNLFVMSWALTRLGAATYGVWVLISSVSYYLRFGDFGLSWAFSKLVAERIAAGDQKSLGKSLSSVTGMIGLVVGACCVLIWMARGPVLYSLFRIPVSFRSEAETTFLLVLIATFIGLIAPVFSSMLIGAQRTDIEKQISGTVNFVTYAGMALSLALNKGIEGFAISLCAANSIGLIADVVAARKVLPNVPFVVFGGIDFKEAGALLKYGFGMQMTQSSMAIMTQIDRLLIAHFISVPLAGSYDVAIKALYSVQGVLGQLAAPLYPASAALNAENKQSQIHEWLSRSTRLFAVIAAPIYGMICAGSWTIVRAWLGRPDVPIAQTLSLLAAVQAINHCLAPGFFIMLGTGHLRPILRASVISAVVGVIIGLIGVRTFGYNGVVAAHACAILCLFFLTASAIQRLIGPTVIKQFTIGIPAFTVGLAAGFVLLIFSQYVPSSRLMVVALGVGCSIPGAIILLNSPYVTRSERLAVARVFKGLHAQKV